MSNSNFTFATLPEEILCLILRTYFSCTSVRSWFWLELGFGGGMVYHPPQFPASFNILLTCRTLHRLAQDNMFETLTIRDEGASWLQYFDTPASPLAPCRRHRRPPFHKFKHIELYEMVIPFTRLSTWLWPNLKTLKMTTRCGWPGDFKPELGFLLDRHSDAHLTYRSSMDVCRSRSIDLEINIKIWLAKYARTPPDSVLYLYVNKEGQVTLPRAYRVKEADFDKYNEVLEYVFGHKAPKPDWPLSHVPLILNITGNPPGIQWTEPVVIDHRSYPSYHGLTLEEATHCDEFE